MADIAAAVGRAFTGMVASPKSFEFENRSNVLGCDRGHDPVFWHLSGGRLCPDCERVVRKVPHLGGMRDERIDDVMKRHRIYSPISRTLPEGARTA